MARGTALLLGVALVLLGIPMLVCPGPGIATILAGSGFLLYAITGKGALPGRRPPTERDAG